MDPALVLFDLDGTLVDSLPDIAGALNHALGEVGRAPIALPVVRTLVGEGVLVLAERALAQGRGESVEPSALAARIQRHYREHPCVDSRLYPGVIEALDGLCDRPLAVVTNKPGDVARALLDALALSARFAAVIGDHDGFARKPSPDAALSLMAKFATPAERTLVVGDGVPDMRLAKAAGCVAAAALWGYSSRELLAAESPRYFLSSPAELLRL